MTIERENDIVVQLSDIHKTYIMGSEKVHALAGVSMKIRKGDFWAIMGHSGSGKSTMLNILGCLDKPTSGSYHIGPHDVSNLCDDDLSEFRLRNVGFIFQSFNLIPQLTVQENIELPLTYLGWDTNRASHRARYLAETVSLSNRLSHRPNELSGGQQQRVAMARALACDPAILLADEPTGNLDTATSQQIMEMLSDLNAAGKTILMVTHEADIANYANFHMHMRDGLIDRVEKVAK